MRIQGAGGCMDSHIYEINVQDAWRLVFECLNDIGVDVVKQDDAHYVLQGKKNKKIIDLVVKPLDDLTVEIILDEHKEQIEVYTWKIDSSTLDDFFKLFEKKMIALRSFVSCENCHSKVRASAKFCPECGNKMPEFTASVGAESEDKGFFAKLFK